jgi:N,N'-diacetyllegionaminate synthase
MDLKKTYIIAEAGVNHNGSYAKAKKLLIAAKDSGADAIKFQTFIPDEVVTKKLSLASYQKTSNTTKQKTMLSMIKKLHLNFHQQKKLYKLANKKKIDFISSAFDQKSLDFLCNDLKLNIIKIPSGEITNYPYLKEISKRNRKVILSTGLSNLNEIKQALNVLSSNKLQRRNISILHCNTAYPTPLEDVNLKVLRKLKKIFNLPIGYSDHTLGIEVSLAAVSIGAKIIEKHFTLNKNFKGPDHKASLDVNELKVMIKSIRNIEKSFGSDEKKLTKSESKNIRYVRKFIVAKKTIKKGDRFSTNNLTIKRSGGGISPMLWKKLLGKKSKFNFKKDEKIK